MHIIRDVIFLARLCRKYYVTVVVFESVLLLGSFPGSRRSLRVASWFMTDPDPIHTVAFNFLYLNAVFLLLILLARWAERRRRQKGPL